MARIVLRGLGHSYRDAPQCETDYALKPVDLTWEDGKTYALLGPSGCGKTTMLNIISGLVTPSTGRLLFDGKDMTGARTGERNIAQVFQFPVIYTTKTVRQNLAFPLECRNWPSAKIAERVDRIARLLDLSDILGAPARRLSADQKQLVSLGRGLVRDDVSAVLLDEPLTVIDPQMKFALRRKLREINRATGITMILVTHDQSEAMSFADEVVVMKDGRVQQAGTPEHLFARPQNEFVGYFIGSPPLNILAAEPGNDRLNCPALGLSVSLPRDVGSSDLSFGVRPEHIHLVEDAAPWARVETVENLGVERVFTLRAANGEAIKVKSRRHKRLAAGADVGLSVNLRDLLVFGNGRLLGDGEAYLPSEDVG
ncbi:ABC transporter ATP-binding protein [Sedimentitalea sp. XS_ASV28]|uniref:ABC transporter ATP-binding protein n=1 Tax=Sedimentitalea sp. XS_ASV28 TaxID=3241296 RepID=UPI003515CA22